MGWCVVGKGEPLSQRFSELERQLALAAPFGMDDCIREAKDCKWAVDEVAVCAYLDQFMLEDPIMTLADLEQFDLSKTKMSTFLREEKTASQCQYSILWKKHINTTEKWTKVSKTALWTSLSDPPTNIVQICECGVEVVWFNPHGIFLQFELGITVMSR